ncbi:MULTISPECIES: hypothetical protein [Rhizobium/Agrobacterium group]|uniref:Flagellar FliJ protein n=2 Tax=Rhizobium/Agrobacterium group TaxID=227290 RepID=B9JRS3_ALLAM|nr:MULTISPECIES: hypothetical protein [Rhizobium/Agrobacterium group]ACM35549.1 conserved hypothetical protein [Allorhizobium ampelinum S4]MBF2717143.1 hypothetical protein [Agrobacterium vitis]MCF1434884.1 hypothetical protein [Allorhizobium ampelinum]MCF1464220.1 hypothetical protein [Allorhizobium ampelinum]MCF1473267.1 hypothetical protein [Allorhizobium ampelinum]
MGPDKKSKKLKRLVAVQRHLEKIAEYDLVETARQRQEIAAGLERVIEALGSMDPVHRLFAQSYADRFDRLSGDDRRMADVQRVQENKVLRQRTKAERLQEKMLEARGHEDREAEDETLQDLIDLTFATPASSKLHER